MSEGKTSLNIGRGVLRPKEHRQPQESGFTQRHRPMAQGDLWNAILEVNDYSYKLRFDKRLGGCFR
jgi:hypothetical protein